MEDELNAADNLTPWLIVLKEIIKVFRIEVENNVEYSIFDYSMDIDELYEHFQQILKFLEMAEEDFDVRHIRDLYEYAKATGVSCYLISRILLGNICYRKKVCSMILNTWLSKEGDVSENVKHFEILYMYLLEKDSENVPVSVIMCVYNAEGFLEQTLRSVMEQTYKNLQIIVVDDCSTDGSREIIDRMAMEDKRIEKLYLSQNSHVCMAGNAGFKIAKGKYVALIGHDDIWKPDKIERQLRFMESNPEYGIAFTQCDIIDDDGEICNERCKELYNLFNQSNRSQRAWVNQLAFCDNVLLAPSAFIRKDCIHKDTLYHPAYVQLQDYALWLDVVTEYPIYIIQKKLTFYRQFLRTNANLSNYSETMGKRLVHERNYIHKEFFCNMPDEKFVLFCRSHFINKSAVTAAELKCERAFILLHRKSYYCIPLFMELLENDETRRILEDTYNFYTKDFYNISLRDFY